jgi:hypothetical protein
MLGLEPVFEHALIALDGGASALQVAPFPATIYMMQQDVINHYRHAIEHYLTVDLHAPFLQNSSLGTPFQKWAKVTNDDFMMLSFSIGSLLRYTSRFIDETLTMTMREKGEFGGMPAQASSFYISVLGNMQRMQEMIGIRVQEPALLTMFALSTDRQINNNGVATFTEKTEINIEDRRKLRNISAKGHAEVNRLVAINEEFGELCKTYYATNDVIKAFPQLHPQYYV